MTQYDNNMKGLISKNERKEKDSHPDIKGQCEINGVQYWISGWSKTRHSDGGKFYSLSFEEKQAAPRQAPRQAPAPQRAAPAPSGFSDMDDDVPW